MATSFRIANADETDGVAERGQDGYIWNLILLEIDLRLTPLFIEFKMLWQVHHSIFENKPPSTFCTLWKNLQECHLRDQIMT